MEYSIIYFLLFFALVLFVLLGGIIYYFNNKMKGDKKLSQRNSELPETSSDSKFRFIYESNVLGIGTFLPNGNVLEANDAYLKILKKTRLDVEKGKINWMELTDPDSKDRDDAAVQEIITRGNCAPYEKNYLLKDGTKVPVIVAGALVPGEQNLGIAFALDISSQKAAEEALRKSKEYIEKLLQSANAIILGLDKNGNVQFINRFGEISTGYSRQELAGKNWFDEVIESGQTDAIKDLFFKGEHGFAEEIEYPVRSKKGEIKYISWQNSQFFGGDSKTEYVCFGIDITEKRELHKRLEKMNSKFLTFFQHNPIPILIGNQKGMIENCNHAAEKYFSIPEAEMVSKKITSFLSGNSGDKLQSILNRHLQNPNFQTYPEETEVIFLNKIGLELPAMATVDFWKEDGHMYFHLVIRDISEEKRLNKAKSDSEKLIRHDLKNPLHGILAMTEVLKLYSQDESLLKYICMIQKGASDIFNLIDTTNDIFQMEEGVYSLKLSKISIISKLVDILKELEVLLQKDMPEIRIKLSDGIQDKEIWIDGEARYIRKLLYNLLKNATDFNMDGKTIQILIHENGDKIQIEITNSGTIPEEVQKNFFRKYNSSQPTGSGLGVYLSRLIARTHKGDLTLRTNGDETTLILTLPKYQ